MVAQTAYVTPQSIDKCLEVGMMEVIHKPVNIEELMSLVEKYITKS